MSIKCDASKPNGDPVIKYSIETANATLFQWNNSPQLVDFISLFIFTVQEEYPNFSFVGNASNTAQIFLNITGMIPGSTVLFRVNAMNSFGWSSAYNQQPLQVIMPAEVPQPPQNLVAALVLSRSILFSWANAWNGGASILQYLIEKNFDSVWSIFDLISVENANMTQALAIFKEMEIEFQQINIIESYSLGYVVLHLTPGSLACFRVSSVNQIGISPASPPNCVRTLAEPPSAPSLIKLDNRVDSIYFVWRWPEENGAAVDMFILRITTFLPEARQQEIMHEMEEYIPVDTAEKMSELNYTIRGLIPGQQVEIEVCLLMVNNILILIFFMNLT